MCASHCELVKTKPLRIPEGILGRLAGRKTKGDVPRAEKAGLHLLIPMKGRGNIKSGELKPKKTLKEAAVAVVFVFLARRDESRVEMDDLVLPNVRATAATY